MCRVIIQGKHGNYHVGQWWCTSQSRWALQNWMCRLDCNVGWVSSDDPCNRLKRGNCYWLRDMWSCGAFSGYEALDAPVAPLLLFLTITRTTGTILSGQASIRYWDYFREVDPCSKAAASWGRAWRNRKKPRIVVARWTISSVYRKDRPKVPLINGAGWRMHPIRATPSR